MAMTSRQDCFRHTFLLKLSITLFSYLLLVTIHPMWIGSNVWGMTSKDPSRPTLSPDGKFLSATYQQVPLWQVLETLAGPLKFQAHVDPSIAPLPVSETFDQIPVKKVLDRLLTGANYAWVGQNLYVWPRDGNSQSGILDGDQWTVVSAQQTVQQAPPSLEGLREEARGALDPSDRLKALENLMESGDEDTVISALKDALKDDEPDVRALALDGLEGVEGPEVREAMVQVVKQDPEPELRAQGLIWIVERYPDEAIGILQEALNDKNGDVQELAQAMLAEIQSEDLGEDSHLEE